MRTGVASSLPSTERESGPALARDLDAARAVAGIDLPDDVLVRTIAAWTQLFGLVSFELFGQTRNVIEHHDELFDATVARWPRSSACERHHWSQWRIVPSGSRRAGLKSVPFV